MNKGWNAGALLTASSAYWRGCTLQAGVRLGIFTIIDDQRLCVAEIAAQIEADERGTELLLNGLAAMGLLEKEDSHYGNSAPARQFLCRTSSDYLGHIILHHHHLLDGWAQLHEAVKTGLPVEKRSYGEEHERESFLLGMFNLAVVIAPRVAARIDLAGRRRLLDLGGGPGTYAIHFCLANPNLGAVIYDLPTTRPFALETVAHYGLSDRIDFVAGDCLAAPLAGGPFDVAWLSHLLHSNSYNDCQRIIDKTVAALAPGGLLMIHEFILDDTRDGPEFPALFSLNMLINTYGGRSYSEAEIRGMLLQAGVRDVVRHPFQGPNNSTIMVGIV